MKRDLLLILSLVLWLTLAFTPNAHAYIDPGVGSMILQALAAAAVTVLVFWKSIYARISGLFSRTPKDEKDDGAAGQEGIDGRKA